MGKIKNLLKRVRDIFLQSYYVWCRTYKKIKNRFIVLESKNGTDFASNMYHILRELQKEEYCAFEVYVVVAKEHRKKIEEKIESVKAKKVRVIVLYSISYYRIMATAKYLFTDTSFERVYVKRDGQIITNTWHGTPYKYMGRDEKNTAYAIWNIQRNFLMSDYLLYPNEYMLECMTNAYSLKQLYQGKILLEGYPRNSVFFQQEKAQKLRKKLELKDKEVFVYMPTWRGGIDAKRGREFLDAIVPVLKRIDKNLKKEQVFYVKFHPFLEEKLQQDTYKQLRFFDEKTDIYEFLAICDCLITDYSSVFFDFANSGKKIVLFQYDKEEYETERGCYLKDMELPFPIVRTAQELLEEMNRVKQYEDEEFRKKFCSYDNEDASYRICQHVLFEKSLCREICTEKNGKENVFMYGLELEKNGITTALLNLWEQISLEKRNYFVGVYEEALKKHPERISLIPPNVGYFPTDNTIYPTLQETLAYMLYFKKNKNHIWIQRRLEELFRRELERRFYGVEWDHGMQFAGYEVKHIKLFRYMNCRKSIFVHNDMYQECVHKKMQHYLTLRDAYRSYDKVAVVTKDILPVTVSISEREDNVVIVNNCIDTEGIKRRATEEIHFEEETVSNISVEKLQEVLDSDITKFITIGRFSAEKGHRMLMEAFEKYWSRNTDSVLFIIGGYGPLYGETYEYARQSKANIIVIQGMRNPMPVLSKCDLFLLSSFYEGLGLTLLEANVLGLPVIATDIPGPKGFMETYGGDLVKPTVEGLYGGMCAYDRGEIRHFSVDYDSHNKHAVEAFESLFL